MAAHLGLVQKAGRFRITVKKGMCISCGNCSTYCEMGIDVRADAMANTDVKRAACVGCGMCAHVWPRGVLELENRPVRWKAGRPRSGPCAQSWETVTFTISPLKSVAPGR
jgi:Pyruvate/2-oxoacid:ferredoxin oxidoreductase delta subunit